MSQAPLVSAVVPTYNRAHLIPDAIRSVLEQDYRPLEVIVVDDGSTDSTRSVLAREFGERIRYICQENAGPAAARNTGIRASHGEYIAFLDSDDLWLPGKLTAQVDALSRHPECALVYGKAIEGTEDGRPTGRVYRNSDRGRTGDNFELVLRWAPIATPAVVVRRSALDQVGLFDETLRVTEDTDLFLRLTMQCPAAYIGRAVAAIRAHEGQTTGDAGSVTFARCRLQVYGRLWRTLPPTREASRGLIAGRLVRSTIELARPTPGELLGREGLLQLVEAHPEWFEHFEGLWYIAEELVGGRASTVRDVMWLSTQLQQRADSERRGRRCSAILLSTAARRALRHRRLAIAMVCAAKATPLLARVALDRFASRGRGLGTE